MSPKKLLLLVSGLAATLGFIAGFFTGKTTVETFGLHTWNNKTNVTNSTYSQKNYRTGEDSQAPAKSHTVYSVEVHFAFDADHCRHNGLFELARSAMEDHYLEDDDKPNLPHKTVRERLKKKIMASPYAKDEEGLDLALAAYVDNGHKFWKIRAYYDTSRGSLDRVVELTADIPIYDTDPLETGAPLPNKSIWDLIELIVQGKTPSGKNDDAEQARTLLYEQTDGIPGAQEALGLK